MTIESKRVKETKIKESSNKVTPKRVKRQEKEAGKGEIICGKEVKQLKVYNLASPGKVDTSFRFTTEEKEQVTGLTNSYLKIEVEKFE